MTMHHTPAQTAALIRKSLKEAFPGVKFSVRTSVYSGGASASVGWTDGPNEAQVNAVIGRFKAAYFDGSIDYQGRIYAMHQGKQVTFGTDYIHTNREHSDAAIDRAIGQLFRLFHANFSEARQERPTVEQFKRGQLYSVYLPGLHNASGDLQRSIAEILGKFTYCVRVQKSTTAGPTLRLMTTATAAPMAPAFR